MGYLTKHTLIKDGHIVVIQGMRHLAPAGVYQRIQTEMDGYFSQGFKILIESLSARNFVPETAEEKVVLSYLSRLTSKGYGLAALKRGWVTQAKFIKYPSGTKILDVKIEDLVRELIKRGFALPSLAIRLAEYDFYWLALDRVRRLPKWAAWLRPPFFSYAGLWFQVGVLWRNDRAWGSLSGYLSRAKKQKKIYIHFGQRHVDGLVSAMKGDGWVVIDCERVSV